MPKLGPTGKFPNGKLNHEDCGEQQMGITHEKGQVVVAFGTPTEWIAMPPEIARDLAQALNKHADKAEEEVRTEGH
jgi:hypothetical protein